MTHEGYTKNQFDGKRDADRDVSFLRGQLQFDPTDSFSVQLAVDYSDSDPKRSRTPTKETAINVLIVDPHTFGTRLETFPADTDPFRVNADFNRTEFTETKGYSLNASWDVSERWSLKSITSWRELDYGTELDLDASPLNPFGIFYFNTQDQSSQEFQFAFQGDRLSLVSGIYYYSEQGDTYDGGVFGNFLIAASGEASFSTDSHAVFGQIDYDFSKRLTGILGFRYTEEEKDYQRLVEDFSLTALAGMSIDPNTGAVRYAQLQLLNPASADLKLGGVGVARPLANPDTAKFNNFSPKAGLKYRWDDNTSLYASASTGFKSGGFNGRLAEGQLEPYDEETLNSFELGVKTQTFDNRLRANIAVFYNDYEDLQVSSFEATADGSTFVPVFSNAGKAVIQGMEAELTAWISERLSINANVGYLDAEYKEFLAGTDAANGTVTDVSDERELVNAPLWDSLLGFRYDLPTGSIGKFSLLANMSYRSKTWLEINSSENLAQDGYTLFNASLLYTSADERWQLVLSGKNLSDKEYRSHAFDLSAFPGVELGYYSAPRTYSLSAIYRF